MLALEAGDAATAVATEIVQTRALVLTWIYFRATFVDVYTTYKSCKSINGVLFKNLIYDCSFILSMLYAVPTFEAYKRAWLIAFF